MATAVDRAATPTPLPGPAEVRAAMVEVAEGMDEWDKMLDHAYQQARHTGSLAPVEEFLASSMEAVELARGTVARPRRVGRDQFAADWEQRNGQPFPHAA